MGNRCCHWKIRVAGRNIVIGLSSNWNKMDIPFYENNDDVNYMYWPARSLAVCKGNVKNFVYGDFSALRNDETYIIIMKLDLGARTLSFALQKDEENAEPQDQGVCYNDIETKEGLHYCLAIRLYDDTK